MKNWSRNEKREGETTSGESLLRAEQRSHHRYNIYLPMRIRSLDHGFNSNDEVSCTVNLGNGGMYFFSDLRWEAGERCEVMVWKRDRGFDAQKRVYFRSQASVVRLENLPLHEFARPWELGVAVKFDDLFDVERLMDKHFGSSV